MQKGVNIYPDCKRRRRPIRHNETDDRCKEVSYAEGIGEHHHHQPQEGQEISHLDEHQ